MRHLTRYGYDAPVRLGEHALRLCPRASAQQSRVDYELRVDPPPSLRHDGLDVEGNPLTVLRFEGETDHLEIESRFTVRVERVLDGSQRTAERAGYDEAMRSRLAPWLAVPAGSAGVVALASRLRSEANGMPGFVHAANRYLFSHFDRGIRETGDARAPDETLHLRKGACRDLAVLLIALCRAQGIAARFVSGYQRGDASRPVRYMHAWVEAYLPPWGWCGVDPTHGEAVGADHVAVAAAAEAADATPIAGGYFGSARSTLEARVEIEVNDG